jgi:hypothetical protein
MVLGLIVTLVGGTGLFAVFTDRATTGVNDVSSGELARAAELQIATAEFDLALNSIVCGQFQDDLATGFFSLNDLQPSLDEYAATLCLRNVGSASVELVMSAIDLTDADISCTGDEAAYGDTTCGQVGGVAQLGELSPLIRIWVLSVDCSTNGYISDTSASLSSLAQQPLAVQAAGALEMAPGTTACYSLRLRYPDTASPTDVQLAQSDQATWRFAFDGTVPSA